MQFVASDTVSLFYMYKLYPSRYECNILVITKVQGAAKDAGDN